MRKALKCLACRELLVTDYCDTCGLVAIPKSRLFAFAKTDRKSLFDGGPTGLDCPALWPSKDRLLRDGSYFVRVRVTPLKDRSK